MSLVLSTTLVFVGQQFLIISSVSSFSTRKDKPPVTAQIETVATVHPFEPPLLEGTTLDSARVYEIAAVLRRRPLLVTARCVAYLPSTTLMGDQTRFCNAYHLFKEFFPDDIARELAENIQPWVTVVGFEKLPGDNLFSLFVR